MPKPTPKPTPKGASSVPVTAAWEELLARVERGTLLVAGGAGRTDLARYLVSQLDRSLSRVALVDAGLARPAVGVPTCLGLALTGPWEAPAALWFVGATGARLRPLPALLGLVRLVEWARRRGAEAVVIDAGDPGRDAAGRELLLHYSLGAGVDQVVLLEEEPDAGDGSREISDPPGLAPLLQAPGRELRRVPPAPGGRAPTPAELEEGRRDRLAAHFRDAHLRRFGLERVHPSTAGPRERTLAPGTLLGLVDPRGQCNALGVVEELRPDHLAILTPWRGEVHRIEAGLVRVDPEQWPGLDLEEVRSGGSRDD